ncbi:MAG: DUF4191 family protein [Actinobacteria bacterium]|nr:DUF4191 family protein [Actinomycetota bacterium]NBY15886.1 DUF4191 family protein [Actinomycetota bacterium]
MSNRQPEPEKQKWHQQLRETYSIASDYVSFLGLKLLLIFVAVFGIFFGIGVVTGTMAFFTILAVGLALLCTLLVFGRIAERAIYASVEGQLGAAASVLQSLSPRTGFTSTPTVGFDKMQNLVHRVIGRPGVILVGEGPRPQQLLTEQKKLHARFAPGVPIHEIVVGENGVTLRQLRKELKKFPKALKPAATTELRRRFTALPANQIPIPKGPMPTRGKIPRR